MLWLASEFCELGNLRTLVAKKGGRVPPEIAITVTHAVLDGLMAFHAEGYVHRDLKPENLLLTNNSVVKIADLGLAHSFVRTPEETTLTARNAICGTPEFMPPEQVADYHAVTNRADLWSVAACLYFFLAGTVPRDAAPDANPLLVALTAPVVPLLRRDPSLPRELAAVLDRALHHDPYKRYPTALAFKEALSR
jgi:serine/threonine protein kinase